MPRDQSVFKSPTKINIEELISPMVVKIENHPRIQPALNLANDMRIN